MSFAVICTPCRSSLISSPSTLFPVFSIFPLAGPSISRRFRGTGSAKAKSRSKGPNKPWNQRNTPSRNDGYMNPWGQQGSNYNNYVSDEAIVSPKYEEIPRFFQKATAKWANDSNTRRMLVSFGVPRDEVVPLLRWYSKVVDRGELTSSEAISRYALERLLDPLDRTHLDVICSTTFFHYVAELPQSSLSSIPVPHSVLLCLRRIAEASDRQYPAEEYRMARSMKRKIIMHVGPTNSGKTYHALRSLAAAQTGTYAGPLRLLAHEIWDRLNKGMICPLGMDPDAPPPPTLREALAQEEADTTALDLPPARPHQGNPLWARKCNMVTGEEIKVVTPGHGLVSCTIEMLTTETPIDVAVLDEIQMITDPHRGFAWTEALLGVPAAIVHVCGEETAVPIVQELLKYTGDEVIINRYERLTPFAVEDQSLMGDWSKVRKGDCVVAFSRSGIFQIKGEIEKSTGMKCAIVYGKLPPEIRSEQAALFNDPNSGYDVIVGSDAIGMGLNLKIRRMIFHAVSKQGKNFTFHKLSTSAVKQIAGRAGRFGMGSEDGGFATTFKEEDLEFVRRTVVTKAAALPYACMGISEATVSKLSAVLPPNSSTSTIYSAHVYAGRLPRSCRYVELDNVDSMGDYIDTHVNPGRMTISERVQFMNAPISWRDRQFLDCLDLILREYRNRSVVDLAKALEFTRFPTVLEATKEEMKKEAKNTKPNANAVKTHVSVMAQLETYHKVTVFYLWMAQRNSVMWPQETEVTKLKHDIEVAMEWHIMQMSRVDDKFKDKALVSDAQVNMGRIDVEERPVIRKIAATA